MKAAFQELFCGFMSLLTGMRITLGQFFKPIITVQYPHQTLKMPARFRGHIELVLDPVTGKPICTACKLCERACPSFCILVDGAKLEGQKTKSVTDYKLNFTNCSLSPAKLAFAAPYPGKIIPTHLAEIGEDLLVIQDHLGHKNIQNTLIYTQVTNKARSAAGERLRNWGKR